MASVRILEITCCGECPRLDSRWSCPPWSCMESGLDIRNRNKIHTKCPLDTKAEYLENNKGT
jgi:hypothetical protein